MKDKIFELIQQLINKAVLFELIEREDEMYARNQIMPLLNLTEFKEVDLPQSNELEIPDLLESIIDYACSIEIIEDQFDTKEIFSAKIMNCFVLRPSAVNKIFYEKYRQDPKLATKYFYDLNKNSNYIQMKRIKKNIEYKVDTEYGELDITINLSKPEKDQKSIMLEKTVEKKDYPKCLICVENEGYSGRIGHPARSNHRMIRLDLAGEKWYFQYSPYVYYNEHCIVLNEKHTDMVINENTFLRLLSFVEMFPHYFLGSNADLPLVGGSILTHDHYQGGNYEFAIAKAESEYDFKIDKFPQVSCSILKWPMSVVRLSCKDINSLVKAGGYILNKWKTYNDESLDIIAFTGDTSHNTITPVARKRNDNFELDLVLRNNRTSDKEPMGIFHPHADVQNIKRENIGLIEVMGLAVLPGRLKDELKEVEKFILNKPSNVADCHLNFAKILKERYQNTADEFNIEALIKEEVGKSFLMGLEDSGVFKRDDKGTAGFRRFINSL